MFKLHKNVKKKFLTDLEIVTPDPNINTSKSEQAENSLVLPR